jgi:hypothetical protein
MRLQTSVCGCQWRTKRRLTTAITAAWLAKSHVPNVRNSSRISCRSLDGVDASFEPSNVLPQHIDVVARRRDLLVEVPLRGDVTPADRWKQAHHRGRSFGAHVLLEPGEQLVAVMFADRHRRPFRLGDFGALMTPSGSDP